MNAADTRTTVEWLGGIAAAVAAAVTVYHFWADRRQRRALAEYARLRAERAERFLAAQEAMAVRNARRRGRPCPTNDQLQQMLTEVIQRRNEQVVEKFRRQLAALPEVES